MAVYGKPRAQLKETFGGPAELDARLIELSTKEGGAWIAVRIGFSFCFDLMQWRIPSQVPDSYLDLAFNTIAYRGKLQEFTPGARRREARQGLRRY